MGRCSRPVQAAPARQGKAFYVRFADDYVACFEREADARRFREEMAERLSKFGLEAEPSKTAVLRFGSEAKRNCRQDGLSRPRVFNFLGFTHYVTRSRRGHFMVGRQTEGKRFRSKLKALNERLRALRVAGGNKMVDFLRQHLEGHIQYYGVSGNARRVTSYAYFASRLLFKWLNRRSQSRSLTWEQFAAVIACRLPRGRILHNLYPMPMGKTQTGSRMV
jgi:RNA-directed DNA polymerase